MSSLNAITPQAAPGSTIEHALQKSEARFRQVVESAPNAMVMIGPGGLIEMVNAQTERLFGYDRGELLHQPIEMLVPERFRRGHPAMRDQFFHNPHSRPMGAGRDLYALRKDGSEFPVEIGLNPIETDEGTKVLSSILDLSARKRMEERFRQVVESAPNAMVMVNGNGRIEMVNAQAERVFGYARDEMLGQPIEMLVPERARATHPDKRAGFFAHPTSRPMGAGRDLFGRRKDGSEFAVEIGLNPIETDEGKMVLSAIVDISDRKQKEERINAALKEKDLLLGEIHHRVKNNLQIIYSLLDLQAARISDRSVIEGLRESQNRIRSMALIHQALYQSKDFARVDFSTFIHTLAPTLITSYDLDPSRLNLVIEADQVLLPINDAIPCGLILNELVTNTLKHAFPAEHQASGASEIRIGLKTELAESQVCLSVSDNGVGLPDNLDLQTSDTLGLQLVQLLAAQLKGRLSINRRNPTAFTLQFPARSGQAEPFKP
ncbi:PAS domain S-box protein [Radicibacter daui]|uniref:PAS domain S-box protein n=1 Tax=Radicibacter daui TaxID=3064829 RepID=UPI004046A191